MSLPGEYIELLELLASVFAAYERETGATPVLVGGAATAILTAGAFLSGDFDIVAGDDAAFEQAMFEAGFIPEDRLGHLLRGYYHPRYEAYGVELVSGPLFDGHADPRKLLRMTFRAGDLILPSFEDLIADRLGQHAVASASDDSRLKQARMILSMADSLDLDYLKLRISQDGGDMDLLEIGSGRQRTGGGNDD